MKERDREIEREREREREREGRIKIQRNFVITLKEYILKQFKVLKFSIQFFWCVHFWDLPLYTTLVHFCYLTLFDCGICISFWDWFMASFLYCFPYNYCSSNYCDSNSCRSFTLLKALAKSNDNLFAIAFKSDNFWERAIKKEAKNWYKKGCKGD